MTAFIQSQIEKKIKQKGIIVGTAQVEVPEDCQMEYWFYEIGVDSLDGAEYYDEYWGILYCNGCANDEAKGPFNSEAIALLEALTEAMRGGK